MNREPAGAWPLQKQFRGLALSRRLAYALGFRPNDGTVLYSPSLEYVARLRRIGRYGWGS